MIALKVKAADDAGLTPLLCVGEETAGPGSGTEPGAGSSAETAASFVYGQIQAATGGDWELASRLVIAYEPVWAIGAAEPASAGYVSDAVKHLRARLAVHGLAGLPVIYGGSAKPGLLPTLDGVSGLFLGRFAHEAANFGKVLDEALAQTHGVVPGLGSEQG